VTCNACGKHTTVGTRFCPSCGAALESPGNAWWDTSGTAPVTGTPAAPPGPAPAPIPTFTTAPPPSPPRPPLAAAAPTAPQQPASTPKGSRRGILPLLGIGVGCAAIAGIGFVGFRALTSGGPSGASSPEAAVERAIAAIDDEDVLAVAAAIAPDEAPQLEALVTTLLDVTERLSLTEDAADGSGLGVDVSADVRIVGVEQLSEDAARVELDGSVGFGTSAVSDRIRRAVPDLVDRDRLDLDDLAIDDDGDTTPPFVIVVRLEGGWFVSPMLTAAEAVRMQAGWEDGDWDRVRATGSAPQADDPQAAVELLTDAIADLDAGEIGDALQGGEARVMRVFQDAIDDELLSQARNEATVEIDDVAVADGYIVEDHRGVTLDAAILTVTQYTGETNVFDVDGRCFDEEVDGEAAGRFCVLEYDDLRRRLGDPKGLPIRLADTDNGLRVDLAGTVVDIATKGLQTLTREELYQLVGLAWLDEPMPLAIGTAVGGAFDGRPYATYEFDMPASGFVSVLATTDGSDERLAYLRDGVWSLERAGSTTLIGPEDAEKVRVYVPSRTVCDDLWWFSACGFRDGTGEFRISATAATETTVAVPPNIDGTLEPGQHLLLRFDIREPQVWRVSFSGLDREPYAVWQVNPSSCQCYGDRWVFDLAGTYVIALDGGTEGGTYRFTSSLGERYGFDDGSLQKTVQLNSGEVRVPLDLERGKRWAVEATPLDGQDISLTILDYDGSSEVCRANTSGFDGSERCSFNPAPRDGQVTVVITTGRFNSVGAVDIKAFFG
jgi:hypothetical protein